MRVDGTVIRKGNGIGSSARAWSCRTVVFSNISVFFGFRSTERFAVVKLSTGSECCLRWGLGCCLTLRLPITAVTGLN